jgi:hypothetical protein
MEMHAGHRCPSKWPGRTFRSILQVLFVQTPTTSGARNLHGIVLVKTSPPNHLKLGDAFWIIAADHPSTAHGTTLSRTVFFLFAAMPDVWPSVWRPTILSSRRHRVWPLD